MCVCVCRVCGGDSVVRCGVVWPGIKEGWKQFFLVLPLFFLVEGDCEVLGAPASSLVARDSELVTHDS